MKNLIKANVILFLFLFTVIHVLEAQQQINKLDYEIDDVESGGYVGTAFCKIINRSDYSIKSNSIKLYGKGPSKIKINKMKNIFFPYKYPNVKLVLRIRFEDKNNTYADVLYISSDNNLYSCHGGK